MAEVNDEDRAVAEQVYAADSNKFEISLIVGNYREAIEKRLDNALLRAIAREAEKARDTTMGELVQTRAELNALKAEHKHTKAQLERLRAMRKRS